MAVRFEHLASRNTILKFATDGALVRELAVDPLLSEYSAVVIDEAHERTVSTDVPLAALKRIIPLRPDLRVVVMSATLNAGPLQSYLRQAPILSIPGRTFPVEIRHSAEPAPDYLAGALSTVLQIHMERSKGDVLVFLTGEAQVEAACRTLASLAQKDANFRGLHVYPCTPASIRRRRRGPWRRWLTRPPTPGR